jgi:hypothetical protein
MSAACLSAASQVAPTAEGGQAAEDESHMSTPPLVSGTLYPTIGSSDERTNYIAGNLAFQASYIDNLVPGANSQPVSDNAFSITPNLVFDRSSSRQLASAAYSPYFTFYKTNSVLDTIDQSASGFYQYRMSRYMAISLQDFFFRTSNIFDVPFPFSEGGLTGSTQVPNPAVIAPFAEQIRNVASANFTDQFGRNAMVGAGGTYLLFHYPNPQQAQGLANSHGGDVSVFYDRRFSAKQYTGISYDYNDVLSTPANTRVHTIMPFYTVYLRRRFSISISSGAQRATVTQPSEPTSNFWSPAGVVSTGWQGSRASVSASYLHTITSGDGLAGAFNSNGVNGSATWDIAHKWSVQASGTRAAVSPAAPLTGVASERGNMLAVSGSLGYEFGPQFHLEGGYQRLEQNFNTIASVDRNPNSDRIFVSLSYRLEKPLGR